MKKFDFKELDKKKIAIIIAIILLIVVIVCALVFAGGNDKGKDKNKDSAKASTDPTVTIIDDQTGEQVEVEADSDKAVQAQKSGNVVSGTVKDSSAKKDSSKKNTEAAKSTSSKSNSNSSSGSNQSAAKPSSGSGSSSGSSGSATKPTSHTHNWQPVYATRSVAYTDTEYYQVTVCCACGAETPDGDHMVAHMLNGESSQRKEVTKSRQVTKYRDEQYVSGYKCSCGATK